MFRTVLLVLTLLTACTGTLDDPTADLGAEDADAPRDGGVPPEDLGAADIARPDVGLDDRVPLDQAMADAGAPDTFVPPDAGGDDGPPSDCVPAESVGLSPGANRAEAFMDALESTACIVLGEGEYDLRGVRATAVRGETSVYGQGSATVLRVGSGDGLFRLERGADLTWNGIRVVGSGGAPDGTLFAFPVQIEFEMAALRVRNASFERTQNVINYGGTYQINDGALLRWLELKNVKFRSVQRAVNIAGLPVQRSEIDGYDVDGAYRFGLNIVVNQRHQQDDFDGGVWRNIRIRNVQCPLPETRECRGLGVGGRNMLLEDIDIDGTSLSGTAANHEAFYSFVGPYPTRDSRETTLTIRRARVRNGQGNGVMTFKGGRANNGDVAGGCRGTASNPCPRGTPKVHSGPILVEDFEVIWDYNGGGIINALIWQQSEDLTLRRGTIRTASPRSHGRTVTQIRFAEQVGDITVEDVVFEVSGGTERAEWAIGVNGRRRATVTGCRASPRGIYANPVRGGASTDERDNQW